MFVVLFEFWVKPAAREDYLALATALRADVDALDGFLGIERFQDIADREHMVSLSTWRDEAAIAAWRTFAPHRAAQDRGRASIFDNYRLRVGEAVAEPTSLSISEGRNLSGAGDLCASIVTPTKLLLVGGVPASGQVARGLHIRVIRDYGPNHRAQAPAG